MATQSPPHSMASHSTTVAAQLPGPMRQPSPPGIGSGSIATEQESPSSSMVATGVGSAGSALAVAEDLAPRLAGPMERLPVGLVVSVPVREFRVHHLLAMAPGALIETQWGHGEDLPLASGDVQLAWSEFEVVDTRLAVRVTRLA